VKRSDALPISNVSRLVCSNVATGEAKYSP